MSIRLLSSDIDGTVAGDAEATARFRNAWDALPPMEAPLLVYNTGRMIDDARHYIIEAGLPDPDYIIGGVGTEIFDTKSDELIPEYHDSFGGHWDLDAIEVIMESVGGIEKQPPEFLHPYKSSWFLRDAKREHIAELQAKLRESGLNACVITIIWRCSCSAAGMARGCTSAPATAPFRVQDARKGLRLLPVLTTPAMSMILTPMKCLSR